MKRGPFGRLRIAAVLLPLVLVPLVSWPPFARGAEGGAAEPKSSPAAIRQYRDAVALQNRGVFDLAADEWDKFLAKFPQDPLAPKAVHYLGVCRLQSKQYDAAAAAFKKVIDAYPQFDMLDVTYLDLGLTQYSLAQAGKPDMYAAAAETFNALGQKFPASKQIGQSLYYLGESLYESDKKAAAVDAYARLVEKYPDSPNRADAIYMLGVTHQELGKPAEAGAAYDLFLKEFATHALRAEVILHRGETLLALGQPADAEKWFASAAASKEFAMADLATLRQADALVQQKKYAAAAALYAALTSKYPQSKHVPAATLLAGNCYYLANNLADAQIWLAKVAAAGGEPATEAAHWLARVLLKKNQPAEALKVVEQALPQAGGSPFAVNLKIDRADAVYEIDGRRGEAVALFAAVAKEHPDTAGGRQALYMAGFTALGQADYADAEKYADAFLKAYPEDALTPDVKYVDAEARLLKGDYPAAERLYGELLAKYPAQADADLWKLRRGLALILGKKHQDAVAALKPIAGRFKSPDQAAEAHYLLGTAYLETQQADLAISELNAALAAQPKWRQADETLLALAGAYRLQNKLPAAMSALRRVATDFPNSKMLDRARFRLGENLYASGDFAAAAAEYQAVIDKWPASPLAPHAQYWLGWTDLNRKDFAKAEQIFTQLIDMQPQHALAARAYYARALTRESLKKYAEGIQDVQAFLKSDPSGADKSAALLVEGICDVGLQDNAAAVKVFRSILTSDPSYPAADRVLYELGWALKAEKQEDAAAEAFARLAKEHPGSPNAAEAQFLVGEAHYQAGRFPQAAEAYYAATNGGAKTDIGEKAAHKLAWAYHQQGKFDQAQKSFEFQTQTWPQGELAADGLFMAAESIFAQGKYEPAWAAYQKVLARLPANKNFQQLALLHAGEAAIQLTRWSDAAKLLERAEKEFPEGYYAPEVLYELAQCRQNLNDADAAYKLYEQAADATEREAGAKARFMMGELLFLKKDYKEAVRQFFKVAYGFGYPQAPPAIKKWQANSVFEAARCFETMKMVEQARKSYKELIDKYPESDKAADGKARLQALGSDDK